MCSGPVGLADTNSTSTARGWSGWNRPHRPGAARMRPTVASNAASASRRFTNPGRATSAEAISAPSGPCGSRRRAPRRCPAATAAAAARAASRGWWRGRRTPGSRAARSPTAGRSTPSSIAGSAPDRTAASQARATASRTCDRMAAGAALDWPGLGTDRLLGVARGSVIVAGRVRRAEPCPDPCRGLRSARRRTRPRPSSRSSLPGPSGGRCALAPNRRSGSCRLGDNWSVRTSQSGFWQVLSQGRAWYVRQRGASRCAGH